MFDTHAPDAWKKQLQMSRQEEAELIQLANRLHADNPNGGCRHCKFARVNGNADVSRGCTKRVTIVASGIRGLGGEILSPHLHGLVTAHQCSHFEQVASHITQG